MEWPGTRSGWPALVAAVLALTWHPPVRAAEGVGFTTVPPAETGLAFTNHLAPDRALANHILLNGSGVALGDVDGDGLNDVFLGGLSGGSQLFRNLGGWKFANVTGTAFAPGTFDGFDATGVVLADLDGDRLPDLLVNGVGAGTRCFRNRGGLRFEEVTRESGLGGRGGPSSFALADVDQDGDLDLYIVRYRSSTVRDEFQQRFGIRNVDGRPVLETVNGRPVTEPDLVGRFSIDQQGRVTEHGEADGLYRNEGNLHFVLVPFTGGAFRDELGRALAAPPYDWGLAAQFRDINGDGHLDLYVCNDLGSPDRIWMGDGKGGFQAAPRASVRRTSWFSMGVDFGDLDRDGREDFLVTDMLSRDPVRRQADAQNLSPDAEPFEGIDARPQVPRNTLQRGIGGGAFAEVAWSAGIAASEWSWSPVFLDVDLDGYEDVLITTGFERNVQDADVAEAIERIRQAEKLPDAAALQLRRRFAPHPLPNQAWRNLRDMHFQETGSAWGFDLNGISQGIALADLDNDGDLDVVLNNQNAPATVLRNEANAPRLFVRLRGRRGNVEAVGARIDVSGGPVPQSQVIAAGGRFLSGDAPGRCFAAGTTEAALTVRVTWPDGSWTERTGVRPGERLLIEEPEGGGAPRPSVPPPDPLFANVSHLLNHRHRDEPFDDLTLQPVLERSLGRLGPGVAFQDVDGDGLDDLVVGAGRGGVLGVFRNSATNGFVPVVAPGINTPSPQDQAGVLVRPAAGRPAQVLVAFSNHEAPRGPGGIRTLDAAQMTFRPGGIRLQMGAGPMSMADVDGDGQLDLFVGGRVAGGRYPEPVMSAVLRGREGAWAPDADNTRRLQGLGLVSGSAFADLDGDGDPDLVLASEWGPIRIFDNQSGQLLERTNVPLRWATGDPRPRPAELRALTGWWNSVAAVDVDEDGRLDLVAGNWGRNSRQQVEPGQPAVLHHGDFAGLGVPVVLETFAFGTPPRRHPWVLRDQLAGAWPAILERFPTRAAFGKASIEEILGTGISSARQLVAATLDSVVLRNRGDHWVVEPLPEVAQRSPVFGIAAGDFNGDGHEDLFLAQNFFGLLGERDRLDSGVGVLLEGTGDGSWRALSPEVSGIRCLGEQRAAAVGDFDSDGRLDLVVTQNGEATCLFRNRRALPGMAVRFRGGEGNPTGVGVRVRAIGRDGRGGPVREVQAGRGYWSQDSAVLLFPGAGAMQELEVRWPGQAAVRFAVPLGKTRIEINAAGIGETK